MLRTAVDEIFDAPLHRPGLIFIDFDHTLFGGNSTELFIANSGPTALVRALDLLVRKCIPWRLTGMHKWFRLRDYVFCRLLFLLLPGALVRWRSLGPALFEQRQNHQLQDILAQTPPDGMAILTFGMDPIVRPMLSGSRWEAVSLCATPLATRLSYFTTGKLEMARQAFGDQLLPASMLITDSNDDLDLLEAVGRPVLIHPFHGADPEAG